MSYLYKIEIGVGVEAGSSSAVVGRFSVSKETASLAILVTGGTRIALYQPQKKLQELHLDGKRIIALGATPLNDERDALVIGLANVLIVRDVGKAYQLFRIEVPDGLSSLSVAYNKILIGGNCSVLALNANDGSEAYWTVAGDEVRAVALLNAKYSVIGSNDQAIRLLRYEDPVAQVTETDQVIALTRIADQSYAFGLANGTIGVYKASSRLWRIKSKHTLNSLLSVQGKTLASGWSDGSLSVRDVGTGAVMWRSHMDYSIAALVLADFAGKGTSQIVACDIFGNCMGLAMDEMSSNQVHQLEKRRVQLQTEVRRLKQEVRHTKHGSPRVSARLELMNSNTLTLVLDTKSSDHNIISALVLDPDSNILPQSIGAWPSQPAPTLNIPLLPQKLIAANLKIQAQIIAQNVQSLIEIEFPLPRFCRFVACTSNSLQVPAVRFQLSDISLHTLSDWLETSFVHLSAVNDHQKMKFLRGEPVSYVSTAGGDDLVPGEFLSIEAHTQSDHLQISIYTKRLAIAADIVQELCDNLSIRELESVADPQLFNLRPLLQEVDCKPSLQSYNTTDLESLRVQLMDSIDLFDFDTVQYRLDKLASMNKEAIGHHNERLKQYECYQSAITKLNLLIQRAANLRNGQSKATLITDARNVLKPLLTNNDDSSSRLVSRIEFDPVLESLLNLLCQGSSESS